MIRTSLGYNDMIMTNILSKTDQANLANSLLQIL